MNCLIGMRVHMIMQALKVFQKKRVGELCNMLAAHSMDSLGVESVLVARVAKTVLTDSNLEDQANAPPTGICHKNRWIKCEQ